MFQIFERQEQITWILNQESELAAPRPKEVKAAFFIFRKECEKPNNPAVWEHKFTILSLLQVDLSKHPHMF